MISATCIFLLQVVIFGRRTETFGIGTTTHCACPTEAFFRKNRWKNALIKSRLPAQKIHFSF